MANDQKGPPRCGYPDCGGECVGCEQGDATRASRPYLAASTPAKPVGELVPTGYLFRLRYGPDHWSQQLMYSQTLAKDGDYKEVTPLVSQSESVQALTALAAERDALQEQLDDAQTPIWPEWAASITKQLEEFGVEIDLQESWDLPVDLDEWFSEALRIETEKLTAYAEDAKVELEASQAQVAKLTAALEEAVRGFDMIHSSLMRNGPKQASGELTAHWLETTRSVLNPKPSEGGDHVGTSDAD